MGLEIPRIVPSGLYTDVKARKGTGPQQAAKPRANVQPALELPVDIDIRETLENLEKLISQFNRRYKFVVDDSIDRIVVKVIDKETDKVIKEIPPVEIQHLLARLREMMGLLVNEKI